VQAKTFGRKIDAPRALRLGRVLAAVAAAIVLASCSPESRFGAYEGVNIVSAYSLGTDWVPDYNDGIYMTYEDSGETYNGAPAYRLRTVNLFPNGDFETGTSTDWTPNSGATISVGASNLIQGSYSATCDVNTSGSNISFLLDHLIDGFLVNVPYTFRYAIAFLQGNDAKIEINTLTDAGAGRHTTKPSKPETESAYYAYPEDFLTEENNNNFKRSDATQWYLYVNTLAEGEGDTQHIALDKIRFLRSDLGYKIRLRLFRTAAGRLELLSGTYKLSVYVKQDPNAGANNVLPASRISLGINRAYDSVTAAFLDDGSKGIAAASEWSDWTKVSATFKNVQVDTYGDAYPCMELTISATDSASDATRDVGSILISTPFLEFLPDE